MALGRLRAARAAMILWVCLGAQAGFAASDWGRVAGLPAQCAVRVRNLQGVEESGRLASVDSNGVRLIRDGREITLRREDVQRLQVRSGARRARNAAIGGAIGLAAGVVGAFATCPSCVGETSPYEFQARLGGGAGVGAGIGVGIGALIPPYRTVYQVKRKR